jgi:DNA-binding GntR family transcriptional regulator
LHLLFYKHWANVYTPEEIRDRHMEITAMVRRKDPAKLEQLIRQHYIDTGRKIVEQEN